MRVIAQVVCYYQSQRRFDIDKIPPKYFCHDFSLPVTLFLLNKLYFPFKFPFKRNTDYIFLTTFLEEEEGAKEKWTHLISPRDNEAECFCPSVTLRPPPPFPNTPPPPFSSSHLHLHPLTRYVFHLVGVDVKV